MEPLFTAGRVGGRGALTSNFFRAVESATRGAGLLGEPMTCRACLELVGRCWKNAFMVVCFDPLTDVSTVLASAPGGLTEGKGAPFIFPLLREVRRMVRFKANLLAGVLSFIPNFAFNWGRDLSRIGEIRGFALAMLEIVAAIGFGILVGVLATLSGREEILKDDEGFGSRDGPGASVSRGFTGVLNGKTCSGFLVEVGTEISGALGNDMTGGVTSFVALGSAAGLKQGDG